VLQNEGAVQVTPDGPSAMSIKRCCDDVSATLPGPGFNPRTAHHHQYHHQTVAASLLSLSLVGLMTSVLAAAATDRLTVRSARVLIRLPTSTNLGSYLLDLSSFNPHPDGCIGPLVDAILLRLSLVLRLLPK